MKLFASLLVQACLITSLSTIAQSPVSWSFSSKKIDESKYEVRLTAKIRNGWHVYAIKQPSSAIAVPTSIKFGRNPFLELRGPVKEFGDMHKITDPELETESWQFAEEVSFVQVVRLKKKKIKTNLTGFIEFQACTDKQCLPAKTIKFEIPLPQNDM